MHILILHEKILYEMYQEFVFIAYLHESLSIFYLIVAVRLTN